MLYGLLNLSFWGYVIATLILTHITIAAVTIYLHRHQAHRALELSPVVSHFFRLWLWLTTGMRTVEWVAIHRKHHAGTETVEDPHSPQVYGLRKVLLEGAELYRHESRNAETIAKYCYGTPDDWVENHVYSKYSARGIFIMMGLDLLLFGIPGITIWAIQMMWIPFFAAGVINGVGHYFGYRNFECPDASRNIIPFGILIGGEELHNNHHAFASSAKLSSKWWEIDLGWCYICILSWLGLATIKKIPPALGIVPDKSHIDSETLKALLTNRFQILARYYREVVKPVFKAEKSKAENEGEGRHLFHRAKRLMIREESILTPKSKDQLDQLLQKRQTLKLVYSYRVALQDIWSRTAASQKELLEALQQWCKQAEATGIDSLRQFAKKLKAYVSVTPVR